MANLCVNCVYFSVSKGGTMSTEEWHICTHPNNIAEKRINHVTGKDESLWKTIVENNLNSDGECPLFEEGKSRSVIKAEKQRKPFWKRLWG